MGSAISGGWGIKTVAQSDGMMGILSGPQVLGRWLRPPVRRIKRFLRSVKEAGKRGSTSLERLQQELSPVFVIGGNRSGTSVVTSILNQHPELEGLFEGGREPVYIGGGHVQGYCQSLHVWRHLSPSDWERRKNGELPFWSLPQYVSGFYRHRARSPRERFDLAWEVARLRTTDRQPLINDHFNIFRIGLIMDVFPRARFVLVTRSWRDFLEMGVHKWMHDGLGTSLSAARPRGGLQWHLVNLIARYDLEVFAPGRYAEAWLDALHQGSDSAKQVFRRVLETLALSPFECDLRILEPSWSKRRDLDRTAALQEHDFSLIQRIVGCERQLLQAVGKP